MSNTTIPDKQVRANGIKYHEHIVACFQTVVTLLKQEVENPRLTELEKARIQLELLEREDALKFKQIAYNNYTERVQQWEKQEQDVINDCNLRFGSVLEKAKQLPNDSDLQLLIKVVETNTQRVEEDQQYKLNLYQQMMQLIMKHANKKHK